MPRLSAFYGIIVWMYWNDHPPPHFHVQYGEDWAQVAIAGGRVLDGTLPPRALRLVREWARLHGEELEADWQRAQQGVSLEPIAPLP